MERLIIMPGDPRPADVPGVIRCGLNPADICMTHDANLMARPESLALGASSTHQSSFGFAGFAETVLTIKLLFEVQTDLHALGLKDVRERTRALYRLAHRVAPGIDSPCQVDLIWGKHWSFRGTITQISETLDHFTADGIATRAWVQLRLLGLRGPEIQPLGSRVASNLVGSASRAMNTFDRTPQAQSGTDSGAFELTADRTDQGPSDTTAPDEETHNE